MIRLLDIAFQSSIILSIGLLLMPLLRSRSAALRHWVLAATLLCAAAAPLVGRIAPAWPTPLDLSFATRALSAPGPLPIGVTAGPRPSASQSPAPAPAANDVDSVPSIGSLLLLLWLGGMILSLAALLAGFARLARLSRRARPVLSGPWVDSVTRRAAAHGIARPIGVRQVDHPALLLVWGLWRPTMIVPVAAETWPADRIAAVVQHELAHIRRADWLTQVLSEIIRAVYWFNPLVWVACARLRAECEAASDDAVLTSGTNGADYAAHIVEIASDLNSRYPVPAPAIVRASTLERRIRAMLDSSRDRRPLSTRARGLAGAFLIATTVVVAGLAAQTFSSITGTVVDPSQGVLPGVTLVLTNEQTQAKYQIKTDRTGRYEFIGLPPGTYVMSAALPGFARFSGRATVVGQNLQQDVVMSIGTVEETITVTEPVGPSSPPTPDRARQVDERARQIEEIKQRRAAATCPEVQPGGAVRMGGNIRTPVKYRDVRPHYPEALHGTEGVVVLSTRIGLTGAVEDIEAVSSTHPAFTDSAIDAVRQWEFDATLLNCERVVTPMKVTVNFRTTP
ncbi:MAG TPA: M56 family metallopeptidase [Vicinamibacterales bacterium]|nr:M56 family metallopeptidase [Vicinamibacterales bacterium]